MNTLSRLTIAALATLAVTSPAHAEFYGGFTGRTVNPQENNGTSIGAFYKHLDDARFTGVRLSHRYNQDILVFADYSKSKVSLEGVDFDLDGDAYGLGFMYFKSDLIDGFDTAFNVSYHSGDNSERSVSFKGTEIAAQLIASSRQPITDNGLQWYAGAGVHRLSTDGGVNGFEKNKTSDTEFGALAGVVLPTSFGHVYAAAEYIDGGLFGVGLRYNLQ